MTQQPFKEVPVDLEPMTAPQPLPIQDSDESPPPVTAVQLDPDPYEYPWIRAWHRYMGSSEVYIEEMTRQAQQARAHHTVINWFGPDDYMTLFDVYAQEARRYFIRYCEGHPGLHLPAEVLDVWLDPTPPRPEIYNRL